ncbi:MAG: carbohydrate kinase family protein [Acidobacteriota bacterium]
MKFPFNVFENAEFDVLGFGTNAVDFLIQVPEYPAFNSKVELTDYVQAAGGEVATTVVGLQRLGLKTAYAGRFGTDQAGDFGMLSLKEEGVDTSYAEQVPGANTQIAFIIVDIRSGERTVIWQRDKKLAYSEAEAPVDAVNRAKIIHFTPHDAAACRRMALLAREAGVLVSLDIDNFFDGTVDLLPLVDVLIASAEFPKKLLGIDDSRSALRELKKRYGCGIVGVTLGESGSLLLCGDTFVETPGFAVPGGCRDTTGAGDAFRVGLLYGLLRGESVEESARLANAVAALKCRQVGARTALPDESELRSLLK